MASYTIHHRFVECPFWKTEVALEGKYYYSEEPGHEILARKPYSIRYELAKVGYEECDKLNKFIDEIINH